MDVMCPDCIIQATEGLEMSATTPHPLAHSVSDAARALGIGETMLADLMSQGLIRRCRVGRRVLIPVAELERFLSEHVEALPSTLTSPNAREALR